MPGKILKELYLFSNTEELQKAAEIDYKNSFLPFKNVLGSAVKAYEMAKLADMDGDEEHAFVLFMRSCKLFEASRKCKDYGGGTKDRALWSDLGGKHCASALQQAEKLFQSLKRRYDLKMDLEKAIIEESAAATSQSNSAASEKAKTTTDGGGLSNNNESDDTSHLGDGDSKTIDAIALYKEIQKNGSSVLILDTRDQDVYDNCHIKWAHCVNIPMNAMQGCFSAKQFEDQLGISDRSTFRLRHTFPVIVMVDGCSSDVEEAFRADRPLGVLSAAIHTYANKPVRPPVLLRGGFESWSFHYPTVCTSKPPPSDFGGYLFGIGQSYDKGLWSYPDFDSFISEPIPDKTEPTRPFVIPSIPDRTKKPQFAPSSGTGGLVDDVGDYVQLTMPESRKFEEDTQNVFDKAVSNHIDMRERLASIGERFQSVRTDGDNGVEIGIESVSAQPSASTQPRDDESVSSDRYKELQAELSRKEAELQRIKQLQSLRQLKPSVNNNDRMEMEQAQADMNSMAKEIFSLRQQLQSKEREIMDANAKVRLADVERLRQERKMAEADKENVANGEKVQPILRGGAKTEKPEPANASGFYQEDDGNLRRSQSSPQINKTPENDELPPITPTLQQTVFVQPSRTPTVPVYDRSTKPSAYDPQELERAEHVFYVNNLRQIQGQAGGRALVPGLCGLKNFGYTCFINSTVQCLSNIPKFKSFFVNGDYRRRINYQNEMGSKGKLTRSFAVLLGAIWERRYSYIVPTQFRQCIGEVAPVFAGSSQQDSQEFLAFLLDGLHEDMNVGIKKRSMPEQNNDGLTDEEAANRVWTHYREVHSSFIVDLFQGQLLSVVQCRVCGRESRTFDTFMYLSLPIPSDHRCRLEDCLGEYLAPEGMTGDCKWMCPKCNQKRDAVKTISIWRLPKVLLIHFKRFSFNGRWWKRMDTDISFPVKRLDMGAFTASEVSGATYTLLGISNHYGKMETGHYTSYCRNANDGRWYLFDDTAVSVQKEPYERERSASAYLLFYVADSKVI